MEQSTRLDEWLAAARQDLYEREPDQIAEQQLLTRVREMRALQSVAATRLSSSPPLENKPVKRFRLSGWWRAAALASVMTLAVILTVVLLPQSPSPPGDSTVRTPFLALVASEALAAEPSALIVSSEVPGSTLSEYGLPVDPARIDQPIRAEFLLSPTGLLLAVRFAE